MTTEHKPHSIRAALEDYLAGLRGIDSNLSLGAAEDLGEKALADLDGLLEQYEVLTRERDAIGAALGEPCAECGHIDWRSDGYADDLLAEADAQAVRYETTIQRLEEQVEALREECADWERGADEELARAWKERALASEEQLEAAHEEILFLCSDEDDIRKGLREQLEAAREQLAAPRHVTALRVGIDWHAHEGMVTVYDRDGRYMGCMGVERFARLVAEDAIETLESKEELSALIASQTEEIESLGEQLETLRGEVDRQLGRHLCYTGEESRQRFWHEVDAALSGELKA